MTDLRAWEQAGRGAERLADPLPRLAAALAGCLVLGALGADQYADIYGIGARQQGLMGIGTAVSSDASAAHYNPANLSLSKAYGANLSLSSSFPSIDASSNDRGFDTAAEREVRDSYYLSFGMGGPFRPERCPKCEYLVAETASKCPVCDAKLRFQGKGDLLSNMYWGFHLLLPLRSAAFIDATSNTADPEVIAYGQPLERLDLSFGFAYEFSRQVAAGVGATLVSLSEGEIVNDIKTGLSGGQVSEVRFDQELKYVGSLNLGFSFRPSRTLRMGLSYRTEQSANNENDTITIVDIALPIDTVLDVDTVLFFTPQQVSAGIGWQVSPRVLLAADLTWMNWSRFEGPYSFVTQGPGDDDQAVLAPPIDVDFTNTFVPRIGIEADTGKGWIARAGYMFRPSPVPEQDFETNIVDSNVHALGLGLGVPLGKVTTLDAALQYHLVTEQDIRKTRQATSQPRFGNVSRFEADGYSLFLAAGISWKF